MAFHNFFGNGQAGTSPTAVVVAWVQTLEHGENHLPMVRTNANPVVAYVVCWTRGHVHCWRGQGTDFDPLVGLVVILDGVENQVVEHFAHPHRITLDHGQGLRHTHLNALLGERDVQ